MPSRCTKLLQRARNSAKSLRFDEACYLADCFGFVVIRQNGTSHKIYSREGHIGLPLNFQRDKNGAAKPYQVRQLLEAIDALEGEARGELEHGEEGEDE
jgi:hypothetical protein